MHRVLSLLRRISTPLTLLPHRSRPISEYDIPLYRDQVALARGAAKDNLIPKLHSTMPRPETLLDFRRDRSARRACRSPSPYLVIPFRDVGQTARGPARLTVTPPRLHTRLQR